MKILNASLHLIWYNAIRKGTKTTEYRDMKEYWLKKLLKIEKYGNKSLQEIKEGIVSGDLPLHLQGWEAVRFHHGQDEPITYKIEEIKVYENHPTFAIKLGKRIK